MRAPLFTVVIPTYNRERTLSSALDSVLNQTCGDFELLVIDDGSTDGTSKLMELYATDKVRYFPLPHSGGPATPRNYGIRHAKGELVAFLDSDDWWTCDKLTKIADVFDSNPSVDLVAHRIGYYRGADPEDRDETLSWRFPEQTRDSLFSSLLLDGNLIPLSGATVRRATLEQAGGFDESENLVALEDYDLWLRLAKENHTFVYLTDELARYRVWDHQLTHDSLAYVEKLERLLKTHMKDYQGPDSDLRALRRSLWFRKAYEAHKERKRFRAMLWYILSLDRQEQARAEKALSGIASCFNYKTALKRTYCRSMSMKTLETEFSGEVAPLGESPVIAVMTTARFNQIEGTVAALKERLPGATFHFITQRGRGDEVRATFPGAKVTEALPAGLFSVMKFFLVRYSAAREIKADLLALPYANAWGEGYLLLEIMSVFLGARQKYGFYFSDVNENDPVMYCSLSTKQVAGSALVKICLFPVEVALVTVVAIISSARALSNMLRRP